LLRCCINIDDFLIGEHSGMVDGMQNGGMADQNSRVEDGMAEWRNGEMADQNGRMVDGMANQNGRMADGMVEWLNGWNG
jgi:hypothetical protein